MALGVCGRGNGSLPEPTRQRGVYWWGPRFGPCRGLGSFCDIVSDAVPPGESLYMAKLVALRG